MNYNNRRVSFLSFLSIWCKSRPTMKHKKRKDIFIIMAKAYGIIKHTDYVNIRKTPDGEIIGRLFPGNPLVYFTGETHKKGGNDWYRIQFDGDAYIMAKYVANDTESHKKIGTINYLPDKAVKYGKNHTEDTGAMTKPSNNNNTFGFTNNNNCANFVNQCLVAGGVPMFNGWARSFTNIPSSWDKGSWTLTNRTRCSLIAKGLIKEIPYNQVNKGDIIFNYVEKKDGKKVNVHSRYPHVVLAAGLYSNGKVAVHGHTENHKNWLKTIDAKNCKCYRVISDAPLEECEKKVTLPETGSGATVN